MAATYRHEIESLHDFFVAWYTGQRENRAVYRAEDVICDSYDRHDVGEFDIEIRNVDVLAEYDDSALVEEWKETPDGTSGRLSTVVFEPTNERGAGTESLVWRHVQETWLEQADG